MNMLPLGVATETRTLTNPLVFWTVQERMGGIERPMASLKQPAALTVELHPREGALTVPARSSRGKTSLCGGYRGRG